MWLEQVFTNKDYDMTVVLHVEPRDIDNYANPDYYWQYDSPEVQQLIDDARIASIPRRPTRAAQAGGPPDRRGLAGRLAVPARRSHVSTPDVTGYPTDDTASRFDASGITVRRG